MYNDLFSVGPFTIHGYGLMIGIGFLCAVLIGDRRARSRGLSGDAVLTIAIIAIVSGFEGAKLLYCLLEIKRLVREPLAVLSSSGFVVYGGIITGLAAVMIYCKKTGKDFLRYFDLLAPSLAIAQGFGRIGCFLAGCCYGRETDCAVSIVFHNSAIAPNGIPLLPTQLFSSAGDFLIAAALILYARKERPRGMAGALYLVLYSVGRFIIEFFRNDYRGVVGALSTSQFISIFSLALGIYMIVRVMRRERNAASEDLQP